MAAEAICQMNIGEFIAWERKQETRHEYIDGIIYDMAGGSYKHSDIAANFQGELFARLRGSECKPKNSDLAVLIGKRYVYPDVVVNCGKPEFYDEDEYILTNPIVLFEVLSDSTEKKDRGYKLDGYQQIPSLMTYVLVSQDCPRVESYVRFNATQWLYTAYIGLDAVLTLDCIGCELKLSEIYRDVEFPGEGNLLAT
jgi:Uma2 family endonuclease